MAYLAPRGRCWSAGSSSNGGRCDHDHHRDLLPSDGGRSSESWTTRSRDRGHPFTLSVIGRLRGHVEELHDRGPIEPRSRRDRTAIVEHLMRNQPHDRQTGFREDLQRDRRQIDARSSHDRGRSRRKAWPGRNGKRGEIKANSWPIPKLRRRPKDSFPLPIKPPPRLPSIGHDLRANFPFKTRVFSLLCFQLLIDS